MSASIVSIDGNIGAGKSSILAYINKKYDIVIDSEPIDVWQPFLNDLYGNKPCASFNMQIRVWLDRCLTNPSSNKTTITERSPLFQRKIFIEANKKNGGISDIQYKMLQEMYDRTDAMWRPSKYVYLRSNPESCLKRIAHRARTSEEAIPYDYLKNLHDLHEECYETASTQINVIEVEGKTIEEIGEELWSIIKDVC